MKTNSKYEDEFNLDEQTYLVRCLLSNQDLFTRCRTIIRDDYFDVQLRSAVRFILEYTDEFRRIPPVDLIAAKTGQRLELLADAEMTSVREWFPQTLEGFCQTRAFTNALVSGFDLVTKERNIGEAVRLIKDALTISLVSDIGTEYFCDPAGRLRRMLNKDAFVSTGWKSLDEKLFGGFSKGGLNIFAGTSGSGKSLVLQNLARNWVLAGHVVVYFTLELSEDLVSLRLDSMNSKRSTKEVFRNIDDVALTLGIIAKHANRLFITKMPQGTTTVNELRSFLKEFEIQTGIRPTALIVDYLDLMVPTNRKIDPSDLFVKDKIVAEELRELMFETDTFGASASQLNRAGVQAQGNFDHSHIAGGISKINTADNVVAIDAAAIERGEYGMLLLKTRSSSGVGHRIKLNYDPTCMLITDETNPDKPRSYHEMRHETAEKAKTPMSRNELADLMARSH